MNTILVLTDGLHIVAHYKELVWTFALYKYMFYSIFCQNCYLYMYSHHLKSSIYQQLIKFTKCRCKSGCTSAMYSCRKNIYILQYSTFVWIVMFLRRDTDFAQTRYSSVRINEFTVLMITSEVSLFVLAASQIPNTTQTSCKSVSY